MTTLPAQIRLDGHSVGSIEVSGHQLAPFTQGITLHAEVGEQPELALLLVPAAVEIDVDAKVYVPDALASTLRLLGWTPPNPAGVGHEPAQGWAMDHHLQLLVQTEHRADPDPSRGTERRHTGLAMAACSCGYTSGLLPREELPDDEALRALHPRPSRA